MTKQNLATALTQRLLSNVRDVIRNFKRMLKPWGGQEKFPFSFKMQLCWPTVFSPKRLALVVGERPKGIKYFDLSIGLTKRGDKIFRRIKPSIELWMLCGP